MPDLSLTTFNGQTPPLSIPALDTNFSKIKTYIQTLIGTSGAVSGVGGALQTLGFVSPILDSRAPGAIGANTPAAGSFTTLAASGNITGQAHVLAGDGFSFEWGAGTTYVSGSSAAKTITLGVNSSNVLFLTDGQVGVGAAAAVGRTFAVTGASVAAQFKNSVAATQAIEVWNSATAGDNVFELFLTEGGGGTTRGSIDYNRGGGAVRYNTTSDYRSKEVLGPVLQPLERVMALKPVRARMHGATMDIDTFVAHEFQEVIPDGVSGRKDAVDAETGEPIMQGLDKTTAIPLLVAAVQVLAQQVADLRAELRARQP